MLRTTILGDLNPLTDTETGSGTDTRDLATHPKAPKSPRSCCKIPGKRVGSPILQPRKDSYPRKSSQKLLEQTSPNKGVKFSNVVTDPNATIDDSSNGEDSFYTPLNSSRKLCASRESSRVFSKRGTSKSSRTSPPSTRESASKQPTYESATDEDVLGGGTGNSLTGNEKNVRERELIPEAFQEKDKNQMLNNKPLTIGSRERRTMKEAAIAFTKLQRVRSGGVGKKYGNMNPSREDVNKTLAANLALLLPKKPPTIKPAKGPSKPEDTVHPTQSINLSEEVPEPVRIPYPPHPLEDRSNNFYKHKFYELYTEIADWASIYFGHPDLEKDEWADVVPGSVWSRVGGVPEFVQWAEMVAEEDTMGWEVMLMSGVNRKWLVAAVLVKIIKQKIFDELLFGGNKEEKEMIFAVERAMFQREGFQRQNLRAKQARAVITNRPVTSEFYADVGTHTAQTFLLLKPLIDFLYSLPAKNGMVLPSSTLLYQQLHNIFSDAGYLALCVRLSPTIFWWQEVRPGENFNSEEQANVDPAACNESKATQLMLHNSKEKEWRRKYEPAARKYHEYWATDRLKTQAGKKAKETVEKLNKEKPDHTSNLFHAKAKIAIWPSITRFKEGSYKDDKKDIPIWQKRGMREFPINCSMVLCHYSQVMADVNELPLEPKKSLSEYLRTGGKGGPVLNLPDRV